MYRNYFKIALRNLLRHKTFSVINVFGLAVSLTAFLLIVYYIQDELSYDKFHEKKERIYRVAGIYDMGGKRESAATNYELGKLAKEDISEVEEFVRLSFQSNSKIEYEEDMEFENTVCYADESFFKIFTFPVIKGNGSDALGEPNTAVLTRKSAEKFFGNKNPIGSMLKINEDLVKITAVMENVPENSHFHFDVIVSLSTQAAKYPDFVKTFLSGALSQNTYVLLHQGHDIHAVEKKLNGLVNKHLPEQAKNISYYLQSLPSIHLYSNITDEIEANGNILYVSLFILVGFIILIIACINYTNLAVAQAMVRSKEVGVRKIIGASRKQLVIQFFGESVLIAFLALICSIFFSYLTTPLFNQLSGKLLDPYILFNPAILFALIIFSVLIGIVAGSYPALFLSRLSSASTSKGKTSTKGSSLLLRKSLIILQFSISILLIISTLFINQQIEFLNSKNLGINKEEVIAISMNSNFSTEAFGSVKQKLLQHSDILKIGSSSNDLTSGTTNWSGYTVEGSNQKEELYIPTMEVDYDFFRTMECQIVSGREFSKKFSTDHAKAYIINETAAKFLGITDPVGKSIKGYVWNNGTASLKVGQIIGVVKDFHFTSLHSEVKPAVFNLQPDENFWPLMVWVKVNLKNLPRTISYIESTWKKFSPKQPLKYSFLDADIDRLYLSENRFLSVFSIFSRLAIFISCLGAFGLVAFITYQRTKEIGIRKVLGASVMNITYLVSKDFLKLVLVANILAWPLAWIFLNKWLQNFAYKTEINFTVFLTAAVTTFLIALITVSFQAIKAAIANPVKSLRSE